MPRCILYHAAFVIYRLITFPDVALPAFVFSAVCADDPPPIFTLVWEFFWLMLALDCWLMLLW
jgi:hypothetical protein